jgi:cytochrome c oxidase cbb3-type subunit I
MKTVLDFSKTLFFLLLISEQSMAQNTVSNALSQPGIIGTIVLLIMIVGAIIVLITLKLSSFLRVLTNQQAVESNHQLEEGIINLSAEQLEEILYRKQAIEYTLSGNELAGLSIAKDERGLVNHISLDIHAPLVSEKKKSYPIAELDPKLITLIAAFLMSATFWLVFGTAVGWYVGIKFVRPDIDHISWLSFGRLRPIHTNTVFWGWASLAMLGLGHFVVPRTCNTTLYSLKSGWISLTLINACLLIGTISLMAGINNGGGEYREFIFPAMGLFVIGLGFCFYNFYQTVAQRKTEEMYISNWYILAACVWTLVLTIIGYLPFYQNGMGETVIQGYFMHQGVGMWFMTFTLGLVYYFLPMSLNKPIYSYSLGSLAFWTQMLFYTLIGTHHYVFSPLPWALQTIAIVFSAGMFIPVLAGTTNFFMTFKGSGKQIGDSYSLPFLLIGVIFYFLGSVQGSFQAFRFTNLVWHFTDFNVAHSHITMYGIISFMLWGCIYTIVPKFIGREPKQLLVGIHFWFALIGLLFYMISMMLGGTLKGMNWMDGKPFIESVVMMMPFWLWRAIGGTLMLISHFVFAYNLYELLLKPKSSEKLTLNFINSHVQLS